MALRIRNERMEKLAREVAAETGENLADAITHALEEKLERIKGRCGETDLAGEIMKISRRCGALADVDKRGADEILGYDDAVLPDSTCANSRRLCAVTCQDVMAKSLPQDENTRANVKRFCDFVFQLKQVHYIGRELFHDSSAKSLMERTAHWFFRDLNTILINYFLLEAAKLTDPARTMNFENFTLSNLMDSVEWPPECIQELERLSEAVQTFRKYIKPARDRLLAHYDKNTVISGEVLGGFPEGEDPKLLDALERICNVLHNVSYGGIYGDMVLSHHGDVLDFKKALKMAIAFKQLFEDSRGDERIRLSRLLDDVDAGRMA